MATAKKKYTRARGPGGLKLIRDQNLTTVGEQQVAGQGMAHFFILGPPYCSTCIYVDLASKRVTTDGLCGRRLKREALMQSRGPAFNVTVGHCRHHEARRG